MLKENRPKNLSYSVTYLSHENNMAQTHLKIPDSCAKELSPFYFTLNIAPHPGGVMRHTLVGLAPHPGGVSATPWWG
jgi:hypothetical protein